MFDVQIDIVQVIIKGEVKDYLEICQFKLKNLQLRLRQVQKML